jgi:beta-glucosidase
MSHPPKTLFFLLSALLFLSAPLLAQDEPYRNPELPVEARVEDLLSRMTFADKVGQMTLVDKNSVTPEDVYAYLIGGVLSGGGAYPSPNTPPAWAEMVNGFQDAALETELGIPIIYGVDAVHGHNNLSGAVIFPHNIGLGAARNPGLVEEIGRITAREMIATGIYWNYAPVVAVPQDIRWGRTYEGYSENTELVTELAIAYLRGLQGQSLSDAGSVLGTPKHFVGDGGAVWGTSPIGPDNIDRGITDVDEETLRAIHLPPYQAAVEAGARSIMISFSSWGGMNMHAQHYLITDVLKGELGFEGFTVSDWAGFNLVSGDPYEAVVRAVNAGIDMNMVPQEYEQFLYIMSVAVGRGDISIERINDAVRRILRVKFEMGLFEHPFSDEALLGEVGSNEHRAVARQAVSQSLVLLKNEDGTLPLAVDTSVIFVGGAAAHNLGIQSGGWTIEWQGNIGEITSGTTIIEALAETASEDTAIYYDLTGRFENVTDDAGNPVVPDVGVAVVGELPYAEWFGDSATLALSSADLNMIEMMREQNEKLVVILFSGRPLVITEPLLQADAFIAAWLPGTEGQGVADVLFGHQPFTGRLPYTWLRSIDQLPFDFDNLPTEGCDAPLFPFGYGLTYEDAASEWLDLAAECAV